MLEIYKNNLKMIVETQSVSTIVQSKAEEIFNIYLEKYNSYNWQWIPTKIGVLPFNGEKFVYNVFGEDIIIIIGIYNWFSEEDFKKYFGTINISYFNHTKQQLVITGYAINGVLDENHVKTILTHELMHIYQDKQKNGVSNDKLNNIYKIAVNKYGKTYDKTEFLLSELIYKTSKKEVDANVNMFYKELCERNIQNLEQAYDLYSYKQVINLCKSYNNLFVNSDDYKIYNVYEISDFQLKKLVSGNLNYMIHKYGISSVNKKSIKKY